jgi:hypothetical protein
MEREILIQLLKKKIRPSRDHPTSSSGMFYYPCGVIIRTGLRNDHVLFVNKDDFLKYAGWTLKKEFTITPEEVIDIYESPFRLPVALAQEIYDRGETGMGFYRFWIIMNDDKQYLYVTGDAVDLIDLPDGYTNKDIKDIGASTRSKDGFIYRHKPYHWCLVDGL